MSTPPPPVNLEVTAVLTLLVGTIAGPSVASVIGPYAVIIIASLVGASWGLSDLKAYNTSAAVWFLIRITATAALLTAGVAATLDKYVFFGGTESRWLLAPVAFAIGWIGNDMPKVLRWFGRLLKRVLELRIKGSNDDR